MLKTSDMYLILGYICIFPQVNALFSLIFGSLLLAASAVLMFVEKKYGTLQNNN